jgi:hypothetical protein
MPPSLAPASDRAPAGPLGPRPEPAWRKQAAWLLVSLAYLFAFPYFERINNPNENARVWATRAVVEHGVLNIDQVQAEWGYVNDKAKNDKHVYSGKAPGASFLGVPVLAAHGELRHLAGMSPPGKREATFWLRLFAVKVPLCVFLWFFSRYVERVTGSAAARDLLVVGLGLGTLLYPYGQLFVGHALAAAAAFGSYMLLAPPGRRTSQRDDGGDGRDAQDGAEGTPSTWALVGAGFLCASCVVFEYQAVLVAAALAAYALQRHRARALAFFAGALPPTFGLGLYHTVLFGRPWRFPFGNVENPEFLKRDHSAGFHGLALPKLSAFTSFLFSTDYGLFVFSPLLALGVIATALLIARGARRDGLLIAGIAALMFVFLAGMSNFRAGWCVGPRYITTVAPFLVFAIARAWPLTRGWRWWSALVAGLVVPSVLLNVVSGAVYPHYPEVFDNPVFDLTFPLLGQGYAPYGLGWLLGLRGLPSLAPLGVVVIATLGMGLGGDDPRPARWASHVGVALLIAVAFLAPLSATGRRPRPAEEAAAAFVRATWEPVRPPAAARQ